MAGKHLAAVASAGAASALALLWVVSPTPEGADLFGGLALLVALGAAARAVHASPH